MKIAFTGFVLDKGRSGIGVYVSKLLEQLQEMDRINQYHLCLTKGESEHIPLKAPNFSKHEVSNLFSSPLLSIGWHHFVLPVLAKQEKYDLIHIPSIRRVPCFKACKMIVTVHDLAAFSVPYKYDSLRMFYHQQVLSKLIHRCDHVIAVSENTKKDIIKYVQYPEANISVVYPGIDPIYFQEVDRERKSSIVYISRIEHPGKNHINLIKGFELFKKKEKTDHRLIFAGADWFGAEQVKKYARESPFSQDIVFLGFVPKEELLMLYATCDLFAYPSLYEGFGFPVVEAMAMGAPVICSNTSSLKEIGERAALLFDPTDPREIAQSMSLALEKKDQLVEKGKVRAKQFRWEKTAELVLETYQKV